MKDLIIKLLKENGRIILPDFGAFIVKTKSPFTVIFNEFLQYNDGTLISAAENNFNTGRESAAEKIKEFIENIVSTLDKGEYIDLSEIGILSKSPTGKITLGTTNPDVGEKPTEINDTSSTTVEFDVTETPVEPITSTIKEDKPTIKKDIVPPPVSETKNKPVETKKKTAAPPVEKSVDKPSEIKKDKLAKEPMPISEYYEDNSSRNRINVILWVIFIVLINGAIIGYFIFDDEIRGFLGKGDTLKNEQLIETPKIEDEDFSIKEENTPTENDLIIEDIHDETLESEQSNAILSGTKYYVVAGVFKEEANADKLVVDLKQKGYNADKFGKIGTLHAVSYEVFPTKPEADIFMLKIKREIDSEAWIRIVD